MFFSEGTAKGRERQCWKNLVAARKFAKRPVNTPNEMINDFTSVNVVFVFFVWQNATTKYIFVLSDTSK